jgi:polyhydroxyalkanoate synthesis regulator phasin
MDWEKRKMFEVLKQSVFTSIGLASLTKDKIADLITEVTKQADLTEQQAKEFKEEVDRRSDEARHDLTAQVDQQIDHAMIQLGLIKNESRKAADTAGDALRSFVDQRVDEALQRAGVARTEDVDSLTQRLELLEKKING